MYVCMGKVNFLRHATDVTMQLSLPQGLTPRAVNSNLQATIALCIETVST